MTEIARGNSVFLMYEHGNGDDIANNLRPFAAYSVEYRPAGQGDQCVVSNNVTSENTTRVLTSYVSIIRRDPSRAPSVAIREDGVEGLAYRCGPTLGGDERPVSRSRLMLRPVVSVHGSRDPGARKTEQRFEENDVKALFAGGVHVPTAFMVSVPPVTDTSYSLLFSGEMLNPNEEKLAQIDRVMQQIGPRVAAAMFTGSAILFIYQLASDNDLVGGDTDDSGGSGGSKDPEGGKGRGERFVHSYLGRILVLTTVVISLIVVWYMVSRKEATSHMITSLSDAGGPVLRGVIDATLPLSRIPGHTNTSYSSAVRD